MLNYKVRGNGNKQIIFIHGNSQSLEAWDAVIENLSSLPEYKLVAIDLPGNGKSPRSNNPSIEYSLMNMAKSLKEAIEGFEKPNYLLVALSLGSNIVGEIITELKDCKGVMLVGSCIVGKEAPLETIFLPNPHAAASFMPEPSEKEIDLLVDDAMFLTSEKLKKEVKLSFKATDPNFRITIADAMTNKTYSDEVSNFKTSGIPLALVFGKEEKICDTKYLDKINFNKWRKETILIPECGHLCNLDQPRELAKLIDAFAIHCFK